MLSAMEHQERRSGSPWALDSSVSSYDGPLLPESEKSTVSHDISEGVLSKQFLDI